MAESSRYVLNLHHGFQISGDLVPHRIRRRGATDTPPDRLEILIQPCR
jgi:hypothetical protein